MEELEVGKKYAQFLVDLETGEKVREGIYIQQPKHEFYGLKATDIYTKREDDRLFFNCKVEQWEQLTALQNKTMGYAVVLATYIHYDNVIYSKSYGKIPADKEDLQELLEVSPATITRVIKVLTEAELVEEVTVTYNGRKYLGYKMNPVYFYRGAHADNGRGQTTKGFNETIRQLYKENGAAAVAFVAKLFPYIDKETNIIVNNPYRNPDEINSNLTFDDLRKVTGLSKQELSKKLKVRFNGVRILLPFIEERKRNYILNPDIATKTSGVTSDRMRQLFNPQREGNKIA